MPDSTRAENLIRLADYYPKLHFGFGAGSLHLTEELFAECTDRKGFSALEILPEQLCQITESRKALWHKRFSVIHCGELLDRTLVRLLPGSGEKICRDFLRTAERLLEDLQKNGISACMLDFGLSSVLNDPEKKAHLRSLLQHLHSTLQKTERTLMLPLYLPCNDKDMPHKVMAFLREMMIPRLKICLQINPHELEREFSPRELAGMLRLETVQVQFCYNADCGNTLLRGHLVPWLRYLSLTGFRGPVLFCPYSRENRLAASQSSACSLLAEELLKSE